MRVKDSYSEPGCPNQNPVENLGVRIIKMAAEGLKIRTGAPDFLWPLMHKYLADVNNHCATPFLGWITPIQKRHGHIPDISPFLNFSFYEPVYFKLNDEDRQSPEKKGHWVGVSEHVGDALAFKIWDPDTRRVLIRSLVRTADPNKGAIPNRCLDPQESFLPEDNNDSGEESEGQNPNPKKR